MTYNMLGLISERPNVHPNVHLVGKISETCVRQVATVSSSRKSEIRNVIAKEPFALFGLYNTNCISMPQKCSKG